MRQSFIIALLALIVQGCGASDTPIANVPATTAPSIPTEPAPSSIPATAMPDTPTTLPPSSIPATALPTQPATAIATNGAPTKEPPMPPANKLTPVPGRISPLPTPGQPISTLPDGVVVPPPYDGGINNMVSIAISDLGQRLSIAPEQIEVVEVRMVTWSDSSMGCPRPGMNYLQVLVDGMAIELRANGQTYRYHSGNQREPFLCERKR